jgi:uncharacterized iron-regulated protein
MRLSLALATMARGARATAMLLALPWLAACASFSTGLPQPVDSLLPADVILIGEQHDADDHQALQRALARELTRRGQLAAVLIEMADQGRSTVGLPPDASADDVRAALAWNESGWRWDRYASLVMDAVRAGIPVVGANLARAALRQSMADASLEARLPEAAWTRQQAEVREGHCNLLPAGQIGLMTRVQVARDLAMADSVAKAARPGRTVLLVAGAAHVVRGTGVPAHLPDRLRSVVVLAVAGEAAWQRAASADHVWRTPPLVAKDYCASLRERFKAPAG